MQKINKFINNCANYLEIAQTQFCIFAVALIGILVFGQVILRYALRMPFTWGPEISSLLFIWMTLNGSAVMFRHGQHIKMTFVVDRLPKKIKIYFAQIRQLLLLAFMVIIVFGAYELYQTQYTVRLASLQLSRAYYFSIPICVFAATSLLYAIDNIINNRAEILAEADTRPD